MIIFGAGMAGCMAAMANPQAQILEAGDTVKEHNAILRLRTDAVQKRTGIEFKKIKVTKSIWYEGRDYAPSPRFNNMYSKKVTGRITGRSIQNIDPVERFLAPQDFHGLMVHQLGNRISYGEKVTALDGTHIKMEGGAVRLRRSSPIISTIPMPVLAKMISEKVKLETKIFPSQPISVLHWEVPGSNLHQTIYYPDKNVPVYRASMQGSTLIIEFACDSSDVDATSEYWKEEVLESFGITRFDIIADEEPTEQNLGKISEIDERDRRNFIADATKNYGVYSLGRFAVWRNILLDDVDKDIDVINRLVGTDRYNHARAGI